MFSISKSGLAAGAAALLFANAAYAAPPKSVAASDPLVALSLLSTSQSRAAVCGSRAMCGATFGVGAVSATPAIAGAAAAAAAKPTSTSSATRTGLLQILAIGGGMILIAVLASALGGGSSSEPVSPA